MTATTWYDGIKNYLPELAITFADAGH